MAYKGKIDPGILKNPDRIIGDKTKLVYRSLWERQVVMWLDSNPDVVKWALEEVEVKYMNPIKKRPAKYIIDFYIEFGQGREVLIEVKPFKETQKPVLKEGARRSRSFDNQMRTYAVNQEKWRMARKLAERTGMEFYVWTEKTLNDLGIMQTVAGGKVTGQEKRQLYSEYKNYRTTPIKPKYKRKRPSKPKRPESSKK